MLTVLLGLGTAIFFGAADFLGGLAARRISAMRATALSAIAGLVVLSLALPVLGGTWSPGALGWGVIAGLVAATTVALLYASLAIGPMSILAPLTAVIAALVPATYGLAVGERLGLAGYGGVAVALVAVVLVGLVPHREAVRPRILGLVLAALAGVSMGSGIVVLDNTPPDSGIVPLVVGRAVAVAVTLGIVGAAVLAPRRAVADPDPARTGWRGGLRFALVGGTLAATADVFMITGVRVGEVTIIGVLAALCSAVTIILAATLLRERLAPPQWVGLALALGAVALFAVD
ncbi:EamA family transporter [Marisediminicola sp. LYQ134]|uniref:EamA family transporter n=1 Tax=unclassified Marisediminicola TaxID=2618316 RepID=UPI0039830A23